MTSAPGLAAARRRYADELRYVAHVRSDAVVRAARRLDNGQPAPFAATSGRDSEAERRLEAAFWRTRYAGARKLVHSLRLDAHEADESCWLHAPDFCLSSRRVRPE